MDTETVFKIIELLDANIQYLQIFSHKRRQGVGYEIYALERFRDDLQNKFIEPQVSQAEDRMNEGGY